MNVTVFKEAQEAYARGDFKRALDGFVACTEDTSGLSNADLSKFYHLIGNCFVKTGKPKEAAAAYVRALQGSPEKRRPSLCVNLGTALLGLKEYEKALTYFTQALDYPIYTTPYKAYSGIGAAHLKLGNMVEAGAAYREAALDPANPAPAKALVNLGVCFMELGRADDAITSYETALEFDMDARATGKAYANLGQAYMTQGRVQKAIDAFEQADVVEGYELPPMARHDYEIALTLKDRLDARMPGILNTGFIPTVAAVDETEDRVEEPVNEMQPTPSGHIPVYGEPGFDPFAPQTVAMDPIKSEEPEEEPADPFAPVEDEVQAEPEPEPEPEPVIGPDGVNEAEYDAALKDIGIGVRSEESEDEPEEQPLEDDAADGESDEVSDGEEAEEAEEAEEIPEAEKTALIAPLDAAGTELGIETGEGPAIVAEEEPATEEEDLPLFEGAPDFDLGDNGDLTVAFTPMPEGPVDFEMAETNMPSPENTQFFDVTETDIKEGAKKKRRKERKARGCGLKIAITLVIICILIAAAGCAAYILGYGYPLQEQVAENFFAAVQNDEDTSAYWAEDVSEGSRATQVSSLSNVKSYKVEAVQRKMSQTVVYVKGELEEGGTVDYELVMSRKGISWEIEYVELYFPSEQ